MTVIEKINADATYKEAQVKWLRWLKGYIDPKFHARLYDQYSHPYFTPIITLEKGCIFSPQYADITMDLDRKKVFVTTIPKWRSIFSPVAEKLVSILEKTGFTVTLEMR